MSLATISSTGSLNYQSGYQPNYSDNKNATIATENQALLSAEQKNTLQGSFDDKLAEQVENIKSNYQSAKDLDLMQAYYQQQQKLIDIYMQASTDNDEYRSNENNDINAVSTLTDTYSALYQLHQNIKEGEQPLPNTPDILPVNDNISLGKKQADVYHSLMMPSSASYLHLSA